MAEINETEINGVFVISVRLDSEETRVCDHCNEVLIIWDGVERQLDGAKKGKNALVVHRRCHSTLYGLMCDNCKDGKQSFRTYEIGDVVRADKMGNIEKVAV